jgi:radical SAM protein with 4Fe4S-binding SPASM domain
MKKPSKSPKALEIQTATYCNSMCVICPYREIKNEISHGIMDMGLFSKIIDQAEDDAMIIPYLNNEPFLDPFFIERLSYINKKKPKAKIEISTNLSLVTNDVRDKMKGIRIHELRLSVFGFTERSHGKIMPGISWIKVKKNLLALAKDKDFRKSVDHIGIVVIRYPGVREDDIALADEFCQKNGMDLNVWGFLDRGGNVSAYKNNIKKENVFGCEQNRPLERMHIRHDGKVILCSMDWRSENILGDLNKDTINRIWNGDLYKKIRRSIYENNKPPLLCTKCKLSL